MERIVYRMVADEEHVMTRQRRHGIVMRKSSRSGIRPWLLYVFLALMFAIQVAARSVGFAWFTGTMVVFCVSLPIAVRFLERAQVRRALRGKMAADLAVTVELDQDGLRSNDSKNEVELGWAFFTQARSFDDGVLLYDADRRMRWLPHAALEAGSSEQVETLVREKVKDFASMGRGKRRG